MIASTNRCRARSGNAVLGLAWLVLLVFIAAGSYMLVSHLVGKQRATTKPEPTPVASNPAATEPERPEPTEPTDDGKAAREKAEEEARQEAERQRLEAERKKQEEEKRLAKLKEKERLEQLAAEEKRKKEEAVRLAAEKLQAMKRNPPITATLEEIEASPDKYEGKFLLVERVSIKLAAVERNKDLGRFTLGVTSAGGTYYSRAPLKGLLVCAGDKLGLVMQKQIDGTDNFFRFKLYCEVRKWGKTESTRTWPEIYVYRLEAFDRMGARTSVMEE